jgi:hypothetical protein
MHRLGPRHQAILVERIERAPRAGAGPGGELDEHDTHDELLAREGHYAALFNTWAGGLSAAH